MRLLRLAIATVLCAPTLTSPTASAAVAPGCARPKGVYKQDTPWAQRLFDPQRLWQLTDGAGQTVAVIGTGVDARNAQFGRGQVLAGTSVGAAAGRADTDCDGRGTFAAGIVAARPDPATTFTGLAPGARLLPIRYTQSTRDSSAVGDPKLLATAIHTAVDRGAGVVLVVVPAVADAPQLRAAVRYATHHGSVVISPAAAGQVGTQTYPTAYPDVISVSAVDAQGAAVSTESGDIEVAAPGADLVGTAANTAGRLGHEWQVKDPQFAAAYVAGAAALVRAYLPRLAAAQVRDRLVRTADGPGTRDARLGWGVVDPYAALTAQLPLTRGAAAQPTRIAPVSAPAPPPTPDRSPAVLAIVGVLLAGVTAVVAAAAHRGHARRWRPGRVRLEAPGSNHR